MTQVLKEEPFTEEHWDDVFHLGISFFKWFSENIKTDSQMLSSGLVTPSQILESSHSKKKQQKD